MNLLKPKGGLKNYRVSKIHQNPMFIYLQIVISVLDRKDRFFNAVRICKIEILQKYAFLLWKMKFKENQIFHYF